MSDLPEDRELSLADLAPERLVFRDNAFGGDGARHEYLMAADLGLEHIGQLRRIQAELARASGLLGKSEASADELDAAAQRISAGLDAFLRLVLPTLPPERARAIPLRGKERMLEWWKGRQPADAQGALSLPLGQAGPPTPRGRRSRASSPPTA